MPLVPSYINTLENYVPGRPIEEVQRTLGIKKVIKLASNENSLGPSPLAVNAIQKAVKLIHRYPDSGGFNLRDKLSKKFKLNIDNVILGAGSEGIMSTIMRTFLLQDDEIITAKNSFIGFKVLANASGRKIHWIPMKNYRYDLISMAEKINDYTKIIYIANPDNPMGTYIKRKEFDLFYKKVPERVLIIMDEAYFEFAQNESEYPDSMTYRYDNVITLRTFSKAYGLAGLRIGYGFAHSSLIKNLMKVKVPFEPSFLAQVAGFSALEDKEFLERTLTLNYEGKKNLCDKLSDLNVQTIPSIANFLTTVWGTSDKANYISKSLLEKGIIVRNLVSFGWPNCLRVSIGLKFENEMFIKELSSLL